MSYFKIKKEKGLNAYFMNIWQNTYTNSAEDYVYICYGIVLRCVIYKVKRHQYNQYMVNHVQCGDKYTLSSAIRLLIPGIYHTFSRIVTRKHWFRSRRLEREFAIVFICHCSVTKMIHFIDIMDVWIHGRNFRSSGGVRFPMKDRVIWTSQIFVNFGTLFRIYSTIFYSDIFVFL